MLEKNMYLTDNLLTQTGGTWYSKNMNIIAFSCINVEFTLTKQKILNN